MKLSLLPKLVEKLVWVPVISLCKIFIPSYGFDGLLCRNWQFPRTLIVRLIWITPMSNLSFWSEEITCRMVDGWIGMVDSAPQCIPSRSIRTRVWDSHKCTACTSGGSHSTSSTGGFVFNPKLIQQLVITTPCAFLDSACTFVLVR
jgi:hypothetical protein